MDGIVFTKIIIRGQCARFKISFMIVYLSYALRSPAWFRFLPKRKIWGCFLPPIIFHQKYVFIFLAKTILIVLSNRNYKFQVNILKIIFNDSQEHKFDVNEKKVEPMSVENGNQLSGAKEKHYILAKNYYRLLCAYDNQYVRVLTDWYCFPLFHRKNACNYINPFEIY